MNNDLKFYPSPRYYRAGETVDQAKLQREVKYHVEALLDLCSDTLCYDVITICRHEHTDNQGCKELITELITRNGSIEL